MKISPIAFFAIAALSFYSVGCKSVNNVERANPQASPSYVEDQRIITDATLANKLQILSINEATVSGDMLKIQATLQNTSLRARTIKYRFEWIRADGMEQASPANSWRTVRMQSGEVRAISGIGPSPQIRDFRLKIQETKQTIL
jgi:uncharacterized protein YcfL